MLKSQLGNIEAYLKSLVDQYPESMVIMDKNYKVLAFNQINYETLFKYQGKHIKVGDDYREYVIPQYMEIFHESFGKILNGQIVEFESETRGKNFAVWYKYIGKPVYDSAGNLLGVAKMAINITDKKNSEFVLSETEDLFKTTFEVGVDAYYIATLGDGRIVKVNNAFEELLGHKQEDINSKSLSVVNLFASSPDRAIPVEDLKLKRRIKELEVKALTKNGELIDATHSMAAMTLPSGTFIVGVIRAKT